MRSLLTLLLALLLAGPADAHSYRAGGVLIGHVWAAPTSGANTEAYVSLLNKAATDQLVSILAPTAQLAELVDAGGNRIGGVDLATNRPVVLKPGGVRIRLVGLDRPVRVGDRIKLTLVFARAGSVAVEAVIEAGPSHG